MYSVPRNEKCTPLPVPGGSYRLISGAAWSECERKRVGVILFELVLLFRLAAAPCSPPPALFTVMTGQI